MEKISIKGSIFYFEDVSMSIDDMFTSEFYKYSDSKASGYNNDSIGVNELYNNIVQPYLALDFFVSKNRPKEINIANSDKHIRFYVLDIAKKKGIKITGKRLLSGFFLMIDFHITNYLSFLYLVYLMIRIPFKHDFNVQTEDFTVLRQKSAIQKFKSFNFISKEYEDPKLKTSIYRLFPRTTRIKWVYKAYVNSFLTLRNMKSFYKPKLGKWSVFAIYSFYKKRIVHALLYEQLIENYFKKNIGKNFYTGSNLDRFSVIEEKIAKRLNIKTYCIPHGIEYGFRFPKGFSCDVFYTYSLHAADYLNSLYGTNKFVFDDDIVSKMLTLKIIKKTHNKLVVYFTEPREINVNVEIINKLLPELSNRRIDLFLKLHPGDIKENYNNLDVQYINDYGEAITDNICISRKSTILLEATYNNSTSIAIITNKKDESIFNNFPSLNSDKIIKTFSVHELIIEILKFY